MSHASKAIIPKDVNGPFGKRIGVTVAGSEIWALRVGAYVTGRVNPSDWLRYAIVVLNWNDGATSTWNPQPVTATIEFRGQQAKYTFPVGVTTLWWYAAPQSNSAQVMPEPAVNGIPIAINSTVPVPTKAANESSIPAFTATVSFSSASDTATASVLATESPAIKMRGTNWFL